MPWIVEPIGYPCTTTTFAELQKHTPRSASFAVSTWPGGGGRFCGRGGAHSTAFFRREAVASLRPGSPPARTARWTRSGVPPGWTLQSRRGRANPPLSSPPEARETQRPRPKTTLWRTAGKLSVSDKPTAVPGDVAAPELSC
ncbi:unnamed protein product [Prorocentrum cordatum]|uniref:Uncharacterized protein n=1 Tax=Prorocentrum cordatum TaxID=2364126 RepID=A0ABN9PDI5_9DINO|nr:unnamed protein product [Polarella glacialis]